MRVTPVLRCRVEARQIRPAPARYEDDYAFRFGGVLGCDRGWGADQDPRRADVVASPSMREYSEGNLAADSADILRSFLSALAVLAANFSFRAPPKNTPVHARGVMEAARIRRRDVRRCRSSKY